MMRRKIRVLLDLSMAAHGYCGIAQDVRLLYKTLAQCPDVEVTGLVYPPRKLAVPHRFCSRRAPRGERLANQAEYLWWLSEEEIPWPESRAARMFKEFCLLGRAAAALGGQTDYLDPQLWPVIWRLLFAQTLSVDDRPLVARGRFRLANLCDGMVFARTLTLRRPIRLDTRGYDFLIVQGPRAFRTSRGTRLIARYHDLIPVLAPDTMRNPLVIRWHHLAIRQSRQSFYVCNSLPTQQTLTSVYPELADRSEAIPYMLTDAYRPDHNPRLVRSILRTRRSAAAAAPPELPSRALRYVMAVSTLEPRKNYVRLIEAFEQLKSRPAIRHWMKDLRLVIVGSPGWNHEPVLEAMRGPIQRGTLVHLQGVPVDEMRVLYTHAEAVVFPSLAEGFGFPPLEAMQCDTPAIVSDLAEHRWVMGDAALYCNPYDVASIADCMARVVASEESSALRQALVARGRERVEQYTFERCAGQWTELLHRLHDRRVAPWPPQIETLPEACRAA